MKEQKKRSRDARKNAGADAWISDTTDLSDVANTEFVGYTDLKSTSKVLAIVKDGVRVDSIGEGENAIIVLDKTPFYGEGGGQVGDTGVMESGSFSADYSGRTRYGCFRFAFTYGHDIPDLYRCNDCCRNYEKYR